MAVRSFPSSFARKSDQKMSVMRAFSLFAERPNADYAIVTDFGVCDISHSEAMRMLQTCECDFVWISEEAQCRVILERCE